MRLVLLWTLNAVALLAVAYLLPSIHVASFGAAMIADGLFEHDYFQPAGVVRASVERRGGAVVSAAIGGPVTLDEPVCITL